MQSTNQTYRRSVSGTVGAGMKSLMGGGGRRYYELVHKVSSQYHKAGETQQIIVDAIEIGRDPKCQVRFDESFTTVSRRHAAIVRDGDNWKLVQLSQTNSTYLNGHKIQKEWYLQNGDEIQLSTNGPKLGFIVPQGDKGMVKSLGLTNRLNLFRQQALRPYKKALTALACLLVLVIGVGGYFLFETKQENRDLNNRIAEAQEQMAQEKQRMQETIDNLNSQNADLVADAEKRAKEISRLQQQVSDIKEQTAPTVSKKKVDNAAIDKCLPYVYYIQTMGFEITWPNGEVSRLQCGNEDVPSWCGTGFLLADGRFVTARHVVEGWYFWQDGNGVNESMALFNYIANNGGKVVAHFIAVSSSGSQIEFSSDMFHCDRSADQSGVLEDGGVMSLASPDAADYAYCRVSGTSGGLKYDRQKCRSLERGTNLVVLGFPLGLGANAIDDISPIYGSAIVAVDGLQQGSILTTDTNYESGNSGGPVFYTNSEGELVVIGIVSAYAGRNIGMIVPISVIG